MIVAVLLVGALWGITNPLLKLGGDKVQQGIPPGCGPVRTITRYLTTPAFIIPQLLNQCGSILFIYLLGEVDLSVVVPVANATALLFNALTDLALGYRYRLSLLSLGVLLVSLGTLLCGIPTAQLDTWVKQLHHSLLDKLKP